MKPPRSVTMLTTVDLGLPNACTTHVLAIVNGLAATGFDTTLIAPTPVAGPDAVRRSLRLAAFTPVPSLRRFGLPAATQVFVLLPALVRALRHGKGDVVYVRASSLTVLVAGVARALRRSLVVSEHNGWIAAELRALGRPRAWSALAQRTQRWEARLAHKNRAVTAPLADLLIAAGAEPDGVFIAGNGTDVDALLPADRDSALLSMGLDPRPRYLGFMGNLAPWQGVEHAVHALALLRKRGNDVHLLIIGDGEERARLESMARSENLEAATHFLGYLQARQLPTALACIDVAVAPFVVARNAEVGLSPLKIRDYAAMGLPVVAPDLPGISELSAHGWLVTHTADDPADLARKAEVLLDDEERRGRMGAAARRYAVEHFSWDRTTATIVANLRPRA